MIKVLLLAIGVVVFVSFLPVQATQPSAFADPAFADLYTLSDSQERLLLWGSEPLVSLVEPFTGAPGNRRLVQYFDRGRMEIDTEGAASSGAERRVTQGLLVRELATGNVQIGYDAFVQGAPAALPIFGTAVASVREMLLTYADFSHIVNTRAENRTRGAEREIEQWIAPGGLVTEGAGPVTVLAAVFVEETGHNIPDVFATWFEQQPFGDMSQHDALGLPITEAYWVYSGMGPGGVSLVQLYERRVTVYTPDLPEAERFTLTNSGRHYYRWRYGNDAMSGATAQRATQPASQTDAGLTLPQGYSATVIRSDVPDLFGLAVAPDGVLALGNPDGTITLLDPANPNVRSPFPMVEFLANPVALAYAGTSLYVVDDAGLHRYIDLDADGRVDGIEDIDAPGFIRETVALAPGPDGALYYCGQPASATAQAPGAGSDPSRTLLTIEQGDDSAQPVSLEIEAGGPFVVDDSGVIWVINAAGQLIQIEPGARNAVVLETGVPGDALAQAIRSLLLYRADGGSGDPHTDLIAILDGDNGRGGRIVRLHPLLAQRATTTVSPLAAQPGAIIDFITGFDRPTHMAAGLDGSLYVYDAGSGNLYWIQPT
ncbi:MAG TPA: hypothetical protein VMM78_18225 [Thermomicrobiales bacterium]|nr:hypothetical protein [Thermomicrobiales bacterium]